MRSQPGSLSFSSFSIIKEAGKSEIPLELRLRRAQYPADPQQAFLPQRIPEHCEVVVRGSMARHLRRATGRCTVQCKAGKYLLPLGDGPPCEAELMPEAQVYVRFEVGSGRGAKVIVRSIDLHFSPPLMIHNILQTLQQVHEVVDDRFLGLFKPLRPRVPGWLTELGGLALGSADSAAVVLLEHISARPRWRGEEPRLRFAFSGKVRWFDQLEIPFDNIRLPSSVLPVAHAAVERLLSDEPLVTADVVQDPAQMMDAVQVVLDSMARVEGEFSLDVDAPPVRVSARTIDSLDCSATLRAADPINLRGPFSLEVEDDQIAFRSEGFRIAPVEGREEVLANVSGKLSLDLGPGSPRAVGSLDVDLTEGSRFGQVFLDVEIADTLQRDKTRITLEARELEIHGGFSADYDGRQVDLQPGGVITLSGLLASGDGPQHIEHAGSDITGWMETRFSAALDPRPEGDWYASVQASGSFSTQLSSLVSILPELDIRDGNLQTSLSGDLLLNLRTWIDLSDPTCFGLDISGTQMSVALAGFELAIDRRLVTLPPGTTFSAGLSSGRHTSAGFERLDVDLGWDMHGEPCLLHHDDRAISLLSEDLRRGNLTLHLDQDGKLEISGDKEGFYGVRYFKALVNPASDPEYLQDLLRSDDAMAHVVAAAEIFNPELSALLTDIQALWRAAQTVLSREQIREPGDFIPRAVITRIFSLLLEGHDGLQQELKPIVQQVTDGKGLDLTTVKALLQRHLGEFDIDYEISFLLNWLDLVLSPSEPLAPVVLDRSLPLAVDPAYAEARVDLPSAAEIFERVQQGTLDRTWARRLATLAPRLTLAQLSYILARGNPSWGDRALSRITYVHAVKRRVQRIRQGYGGVEYALQPFIIASFLGEAVGPLPGVNIPGAVDQDGWPPPCALGPDDVASLLMAGLASSGRQGGMTQRNNRLLVELLRREAPDFTRAVMVELGSQSPRALSGVLYAFLAQDQDLVTPRIDLVDLLAQKLQMPIPRQRDYLAGGEHARRSYYEALSRLADAIIDSADPYLSAKQHLQVVRHQVAPEVIIAPSNAQLTRRAEDCIRKADALAAGCTFDRDDRGGPRQRSREAYRRAFRACGRLLSREPRAFQLPWFKAFWARNEEALKVLSMVRGHQEDVDDDRRWLRIRSGRGQLDGEQDLLQTIVRNIYLSSADQQALLDDPLVRLLIDPPPGRYDFTIVGCMGVITDGEDGKELECAYRRLEERRGIRIIRAHTGIARSLEYNARMIIEAIEACTTPWGIIGYSQGCANALFSESALRGGTPDQQQLLDGLVCRNLLFSSANGSAHGTAGMLKFRRAMALGERYLKHYQAIYSKEAVDVVLRAFKGLLDSRLFVAVLGGAHSLTHERARVLHRDSQFLDRVPTSYTRGVVDEAALPEMLEYLYHMLCEQTGSVEQDTQVLIWDAVGRSTVLENEHTRLLERCDMGSLPQDTHHWAPLTREIEFVTTERDRALAVYQSPKDRLVRPWVEVNARFGRIDVLG